MSAPAAEQSIRALVSRLETAGALVRIVKPVDPRSNLAALAFQARTRLGKATWFESPFGHFGWHVAAQLLADRTQWAHAFGLDGAALLFTLRERLKARQTPVDGASAPVKAVRATGAQVDLAKLPAVLTCADDPGRRVIGVALARDPETGRILPSLADLGVLGRDRASVGWLSPALRELHARARRAGRALPIAVTVGGPPALYLAAALAQFMPGADLGLAGGLLDAPLELAHLDGLDVPVPAHAELAIGGTLAADETVDLAPRGGLLGLYAAERAAPVLQAAALLHRVNPVHYAMQVGAPPNDLAGTMALAIEILVAEHVRNIEGGLDLIDVRCHPAGGDLVLAVKLRPRVEGQSKTALIGALSGPAFWPKLAIGVDEDIDAGDLRDVFWSAASRTHAETDVGMIDGVRAHADDAASPFDGDGASGERIGTRWFIDSTMPPLTQPERRLSFARATPKNLEATPLADFLPPG
ncbi:MAG TPA: UbiD family decarboxylase [Candidatus Sulfotelmatobacter sp.]|nr:UbiD family decarboxylase [Candidatus Sulfotelmatobacter sp.]